MVHHRQPMDVDLQAIAHAYASGAQEYARKFGDDLVQNEFDRGLVDAAITGFEAQALVFDIGCGPGQVSAHVRGSGHAAVSVDLTVEMLHVARDGGAARALVCADVQRLPIVTACGDAAVCWYSLHHLPRAALPAVLAELRRVLRVGGRLLIGTHGGAGDELHPIEWQGRREHVTVSYYAEGELAGLVGRAGFREVGVCRRDPLSHEHQAEKLYVTGLAD